MYEKLYTSGQPIIPSACKGCPAVGACVSNMNDLQDTLDGLRAERENLHVTLAVEKDPGKLSDIATRLGDNVRAQGDARVKQIGLRVTLERKTLICDLARETAGENADCFMPASLTAPRRGGKHRKEKVRPRGRLGTAALGITAVVTTLAMSANHTPEVSAAPLAPVVVQPRELCEPQVTVKTALSADACKTLPAFPGIKGSQEYPAGAVPDPDACDSGNSNAHSSSLVAVIGGNPKNDNLNYLPKGFKQSVETALKNPVTNYLARKHVENTYIYQSDQSSNGYYNDDTDLINLCYQIGVEDTLYNSEGSAQSILTHEGGHAMHFSWIHAAQRGDTQTEALLNDLSDVCVDDMTAVAESFRQEDGSSMISLFTELRDVYTTLPNKDDYRDMIGAIDQLITMIGSEEDFSTIALSYVTSIKGKAFSDCNLSSMPWLLFQASDWTKSPLQEISYKIGGNIWNELNGLQFNYFNGKYSHFAENAVLGGMGGFSGGHPFNTTEQVASIIDSTQGNPDGEIDRIEALPANRQFNAIKELYLILQLTERNDPQLIKDGLLLPYVVNTLFKLHPEIAAQLTQAYNSALAFK